MSPLIIDRPQLSATRKISRVRSQARHGGRIIPLKECPRAEKTHLAILRDPMER